MLNHGRKNIVFGFCYLVILLIMGMFLAIKLKDTAWAKEPFAFPRVVIRAAHAHGNLESVLNILVGLLVDRISVGDGLKKTISMLMIIGAVMHSGMLLLTPLFPAISNLAVVGAITLVIAIALMAYGAIAGIEKK